MVFERLAERIQRAGADVAVHDAERAECQRAHPRRVPVGGVVGEGLLFCPAVGLSRLLCGVCSSHRISLHGLHATSEVAGITR